VHFGKGVLGTPACADAYVIQVVVGHPRTHLRHSHCRVCTYVYVHMYMYAHAYTYVRLWYCVWVYICTRVSAFCLFVQSNLFTTCVCITGVCLTPVCMCRRELEVGGLHGYYGAGCYINLNPKRRGGLYFGRGRDRGFVLYIFLFLRVLEWWVGFCLYTRVQTHKILRYLVWAQLYDGHLESRKNPNRLKRTVHFDGMLGCGFWWPVLTAFFLLRCLFFWKK